MQNHHTTFSPLYVTLKVRLRYVDGVRNWWLYGTLDIVGKCLKLSHERINWFFSAKKMLVTSHKCAREILGTFRLANWALWSIKKQWHFVLSQTIAPESTTNSYKIINITIPNDLRGNNRIYTTPVASPVFRPGVVASTFVSTFLFSFTRDSITFGTQLQWLRFAIY